MAASITSAGRFSPLGPRAHLPLIEVKISGPHGAGQYLRRALSACFLDFDHYRGRVDFRQRWSDGDLLSFGRRWKIKREVIEGSRAGLQKAALPIIVAIGGFVVPTLFYAALNWGDSQAF
jgi:hypothetical protein